MVVKGESRGRRHGDGEGERTGGTEGEPQGHEATLSFDATATDAGGHSGDQTKGKAARETVYRKFSAMLPDEVIRKIDARVLITGESKSELLQKALEPLLKGVRLPSVPGYRTDGSKDVSAA